MELSMDLAVDDPGLEAGVRAAKGYCRCHGSELNDFQGQSLRKSWRKRLSSCEVQYSSELLGAKGFKFPHPPPVFVL